MKFSLVAAFSLLLSQSSAFQVAPARQQTLTQLNMFGGAGAGKPTEDSPEEAAQIEQTAKAMGMSVDEYMIAMNARTKLAETLDSTMITTGSIETVLIERDVNNPPKSLDIKISEAGKAMGTDALSKELCSSFKKSADDARKGRADAQKDMMTYISEQLK
jgi:hypothetical protein